MAFIHAILPNSVKSKFGKEVFERAKKALESKRATAVKSDTEPNRRAMINANETFDSGMGLIPNMLSGNFVAPTISAFTRAKNHFLGKGYNEKDSLRLAEILIEQNKGNNIELLKRLATRPQAIDETAERLLQVLGRSATTNKLGSPDSPTRKNYLDPTLRLGQGLLGNL